MDIFSGTCFSGGLDTLAAKFVNNYFGGSESANNQRSSPVGRWENFRTFTKLRQIGVVSRFENVAGEHWPSWPGLARLAATKEISRSNLSGADWVVGQSQT
jgi:hypothetical protein